MKKISYVGFFICLFFSLLVPKANGKNKTSDKYSVSQDNIKTFIDFLNHKDFNIPDFSHRLAYFMDSVIYQQPDTIFNVSCRLIDNCSSDKAKQWTLDFLFYRAIDSQIPWMENVWVKLAERYYLKQPFGNEDPGWIERLKYTVKLKKHCLIGEKAVLFTALTPQGDTLNLKYLSGKYMIICFYDPDCTHCKEAIPSLHKLYKKYTPKELSIVAFNISDDINLWRSFIQKHKLQDWTNLWDPDRDISQYDNFYDTPLSPSFYILDSERRIISKDIEIEEVKTFLTEQLSAEN